MDKGDEGRGVKDHPGFGQILCRKGATFARAGDQPGLDVADRLGREAGSLAGTARPAVLFPRSLGFCGELYLLGRFIARSVPGPKGTPGGRA